MLPLNVNDIPSNSSFGGQYYGPPPVLPLKGMCHARCAGRGGGVKVWAQSKNPLVTGSCKACTSGSCVLGELLCGYGAMSISTSLTPHLFLEAARSLIFSLEVWGWRDIAVEQAVFQIAHQQQMQLGHIRGVLGECPDLIVRDQALRDQCHLHLHT